MVKKTEKEQNMILIRILYLKENITMIKDGMENYMMLWIKILLMKLKMEKDL